MLGDGGGKQPRLVEQDVGPAHVHRNHVAHLQVEQCAQGNFLADQAAVQFDLELGRKGLGRTARGGRTASFRAQRAQDHGHQLLVGRDPELAGVVVVVSDLQAQGPVAFAGHCRRHHGIGLDGPRRHLHCHIDSDACIQQIHHLLRQYDA